MRLHVLGELVEPASPPGRLRAATEADADLCLAWFQVFDDEAAAQAGRPHGHGGDHVDLESSPARSRGQEIWLWEDAAGEVAHLTAHNPPAFGVARVGPVYTPAAHRGTGTRAPRSPRCRGCCARPARRSASSPTRANATSNKIYAAIGYRPVVDMADFRVS